MENDDLPVGRILTRREALALLGMAGSAALIAACAPGQSGPTNAPTSNAQSPTAASVASNPTAAATAQMSDATAASVASTTVPNCVARPALTEGPYFVDEKLNRSDIRSDPSDNSVKTGIPLVLTFNVSQITDGNCTPLQGAQVDVWHCDAQGQYSDVSDRGFQTKGQKWLRGYQMTDANGVAKFTTIYPGWYSGRTTHIHFKIRNAAGNGQTHEFTSQLFFDDALNAQVYAKPPYATRGNKDMPNTRDTIFSNELVLNAQGDANGYASAFNIALDI